MSIDAATLQKQIDRWIEAELAGDAAALDALAIDEFALVGPLGFVLDRTAWLDRYTDGGLVTTSLAFTDRQLRILGGVALVIGVHEQTGSYGGRPNDGRYRVTQIWIDPVDGPQLAGLQFSPLPTPPAR
jgi:ketosteroid isomerase-like protein